MVRPRLLLGHPPFEPFLANYGPILHYGLPGGQPPKTLYSPTLPYFSDHVASLAPSANSRPPSSPPPDEAAGAPGVEAEAAAGGEVGLRRWERLGGRGWRELGTG